MTTTTNPLTDRTNVTPTSYDYNGTTYTKQTRTDGNGNPYTVDIANSTPAVPAVTTPTGATTPPATTGVVTTPTPNTGTTPQTIGSVYGIDPNKASSDYASYLANPDQYLSNQGISVGDLKSKALAELQSSIDATNAVYGEKLRQAKIQGQGILGSGTAIQARRGLIGSDFGSAQTEGINNSNAQIYNSIEAERAAKIADLMSGAQSKAEQRFAEQRASIEGGLKSRLEFLKGADERAKTAATDAASAFVAQGTDPSIMDTATLNEYAKAHGTTPEAIKTAFTLNTYNTKQAKIKADQEVANKLAEKGVENIGEGQSGYRYNPTTKQYELVAHVNKTYAPKAGTGTGSGVGSGVGGVSPQAQVYIDAVNNGASLDDILKGTSKEVQAMRGEVLRGLNLQGGQSKKNVQLLTEGKAIVDDMIATGADKALGGYSSAFGGQLSTDYGDAKAKAAQLSAILARDNLGLLKGSMSDKDLQFIQAMSTGFDGQGIQSEKYISDRMLEIQKKLQDRINSTGLGEVNQSKAPVNQTPVTPELNSLRSKYGY